MVETGRVDDRQYGVGRGRTLDASEHDTYRNLLVRGVGAQGIGAGQIDQVERRFAELQSSRAPLHRDPWVVRRFLAHACEPIEDRALAGVRIADDGDRRVRPARYGDVLERDCDFTWARHAFLSTSKARACCRRNEIAEPCTRNSRGSPPIDPRRNSISAPSTRPMTIRR